MLVLDRVTIETIEVASHDDLAQTIADRTGGRIRLVTRTSLLPFPCAMHTYTNAQAIRVIRQMARSIAQTANVEEKAQEGWEVAVAEAATNGLVHGTQDCRYGFRIAVHRLICRIIDRGTGIPKEHIIPALCEPGYSTRDSAGMGFCLMAELVSHVLVVTDANGTTVQLELDIP